MANNWYSIRRRRISKMNDFTQLMSCSTDHSKAQMSFRSKFFDIANVITSKSNINRSKERKYTERFGFDKHALVRFSRREHRFRNHWNTIWTVFWLWHINVEAHEEYCVCVYLYIYSETMVAAAAASTAATTTQRQLRQTYSRLTHACVMCCLLIRQSEIEANEENASKYRNYPPIHNIELDVESVNRFRLNG